jgi:hypothetical protein
MTKKVHPPGCFFSNDHGNPFATIRKNFVSGQTWNPYMMKDEHVDKTWTKANQDPNLSDKEAFDEMKKLNVYCIDQAHPYGSRPLRVQRLVALGQELLRRDPGGGLAAGPDPGPHLDRPGNEEEDGVQ